MKELLKALAAAKEEIQPIIKSETNPFFKSKYFDINALLLQIEPILHAHGLILVQPIEFDKIVSKIYHVETGQVIESSMVLPQLQDPQKMGSAVTYYRRHTVQSLLALQAADDDAEVNRTPSTTKKPIIERDSQKWNDAVEYMSTPKADISVITKHYSLSASDLASLKGQKKSG